MKPFISLSADKRELVINLRSNLKKQHLNLFYWITLSFIAINTFFVMNELYWFSILPVVLLLVIFSIVSIDILILIIVFCTPLSINYTNISFGIGVSVPSEPLMFGVMLIFFLKLVYEMRFDRKIISHPVTIAIICYLLWMSIATICSTMPVVSLKHLVSQLWFITVFYFLGTQLFKKYLNIKRFVWLYMIPLLGVIFYTITNHYQLSFSEESAHWVMSPFYNDHTAYAAAIAMFVPIMIVFLWDTKYSIQIKIFITVIVIVFTCAIILSYTRAAWVSLAVALVVYLMFLFRIKFRTLLILIGSLGILYFVFQSQILMKLEKNRQDSSTNYAAHIQSISNISTDASNLERINRWKSAMRMFYEKPIVGWGPGTYQFKYAPFQHSKEMTIISTNAGDRGNAHSEYIGPLAESGILGSLAFIFIVITVIYKSAKLYFKTESKEIRLITIGILLGLITYFVHGMLNNFLDTDKAAVPFWGFVAILTALDVYHSNDSKKA